MLRAITLVVSAGLLLASPGQADAATPHVYYVYQVQITGPAIPNVIGAQAFNRTGYLYLTSTISTKAVEGDVNAVDFYLESGTPAGSPSPGAIVFATNSAAAYDGGLAFRNAMLDLASQVKVTGNTVTVTPYKTLTQQYLYFTASSRSTASLYMIQTGSVTLQFNSNLTALTGGTIDLYGQAAGYPLSTPDHYHATITGKLLGTVTY